MESKNGGLSKDHTERSGNIIYQVIDFLRFPLIIGVIFIHARLYIERGGEIEGDPASVAGTANTIRYLISDILARLAVPLFFFFSGFLFFNKVDVWNRSIYFSKLKTRARSLLIPYLFWNTLMLLFIFAAQNTPGLSGLFSGANKPVADFSLTDFLSVYWNYNSGLPLLYPLWFIRNLIVIVVFSPLIWGLIHYTKIWGIIAAGIFWYFYEDPVFFFAMGAYFGIQKIDFVAWCHKWGRLSIIGYAILAAANLYFSNNANIQYLHKIGILVGMVAVIHLTAIGLERKVIRTSLFLSAASFFVFLSHEQWLTFIRKILFVLFQPASQGQLLLCFFGQVALILVLTLSAFAILRRYWPKFTAFITGGR